ncbi:O-antigen ligase family protein [Vreelandella andesensis]|uniref:O-antigen ligase family protein n=1 Tax=Vreelandella andesensis TaxID=447567 RepID=A0A3S1DJ80_9GAMM|nr:O-antigen ligase [Halomonas andesensis]RUR27821.1 O-antigen ligase family protein [Halomonas andesensis]
MMSHHLLELSARLRLYNTCAVFLFGALALVVPSGYSVGVVMLLLGSGVLLINRPPLNLTRQDRLIIGVMVVYAVVSMAWAWWDGQGTRGFDKPSRFIFAVPVVLTIIAYPPRLSSLWAGLAVGAIGAGGWASWQKLAEGAWRATGYTHVIQFGNLSMLMGILCLAGLGWASCQPRRLPWFVFMLLGAFMGILGSLLSGSRGSWPSLPFVLVVLYISYGRQLPGLIKGVLLILLVTVGTSVYMVPQLGVQSRVHQAYDDVARYASGENLRSSVGDRFEMWKGASHLIQEKPFLGWGQNGYQDGMQSLADSGVINPYVTVYGHSHNDFIDTWAKRGLVGLIALLALYLIPLRLFFGQLNHPNHDLRSLAVAGVLLPVAYINFGLSQAFLAHNSGVMMYAFLLAVLWGCFTVRAKT